MYLKVSNKQLGKKQINNEVVGLKCSFAEIPYAIIDNTKNSETFPLIV